MADAAQKTLVVFKQHGVQYTVANHTCKYEGEVIKIKVHGGLRIFFSAGFCGSAPGKAS